MKNARNSGACALLGATLLLASCAGGGQGVTVPEGWERLPDCPVATIPAEDLSTTGTSNCNLEGSSITLPDGTDIQIGAVGDVRTHSEGNETTAVVVNWGTPGAAVYVSDGKRLMNVWSTSDEAGKLQREQARVDEVR